MALFAALSYAVTQSGRGGGSVDKEKTELVASRISSWLGLVQKEYQKIRIINGYGMDHLDLRVKNSGVAQPCQGFAEPDCALYVSKSGQVPDLPFSSEEYVHTELPYCAGWDINPDNNAGAYTIRMQGVGSTSGGDLIIKIVCVKPDVCRAYNRSLGLSDTYPLDTFNEAHYTFSAGGSIPEPAAGANSDIGDEVAELQGKTTYCVRDGNDGGLRSHIIFLLEAR